MSNKKMLVLFGCVLVVFICIGLFLVLAGGELRHNERSISNILAFLNEQFGYWKNKGYAYTGKRYPHALPYEGGSCSTNAGKFSGLYYESNSAGEDVTWISHVYIAADFRADGDTSCNFGMGYYYASTNIDGTPTWRLRSGFELKPIYGYWIGLMDYYNSNGSILRYDPSYARNHFALIAIPADYGKTGEHTFIVNEKGLVYKKDLKEETGYLDTFPGPDPTLKGWEKIRTDPLKVPK